jgi:hypothetical protein
VAKLVGMGGKAWWDGWLSWEGWMATLGGMGG